MRKGLLVAVLAGLTFASSTWAAEMVRYDRDVYADNARHSHGQQVNYNRKHRGEVRDTRLDSHHRSGHPINWVAGERK
jgi:hypothetical protein